MSEISRRQFLEFMGRGLLSAGALSALPACTGLPHRTAAPTSLPDLPFAPIAPSREDKLILCEGMRSQVVLSWGDSINLNGERFGFNNDFTAFIPLDSRHGNEGLLWVNHEYHDPYYTRGWRPGQTSTAADHANDRKEVGGSILHLRKLEGAWKTVSESKYNRRIDAFTKIPIISERPIVGTKTAVGTFANCGGGVTPWRTILTCEENYHSFVGEVEFHKGRRTVRPPGHAMLHFASVDLPPEHYGWVVEVDPFTGRAMKLTGLGRFAHESATCIVAGDGRTVVYSGDDCDAEHLYKFISSKPGSLKQGTLYVADIDAGRWLALDWRKDKRFHKTFRDQTDLLVRTREAAKIVGATPLNRPEDIEIDPQTRAVFVSQTMSPRRGDMFGSLLKLEEKDADPLSMEFRASTFLAGGPETGFANPDNLIFDQKGGLWMCGDMPHTNLNRGDHAVFANNGLFYIPLHGPLAGRAFQVASAPRGAELTGPSFSPDGKTLFLSVQHPGEHVYLRPEMASTWPGGLGKTPKPSVVAISGPALERLVSG